MHNRMNEPGESHHTNPPALESHRRALSFPILFKNNGFLFLFALLAVFAGFSLPNLELHDLLARAIQTGLIPPLIGIFVLMIAFFINLYVLSGSLRPKYALMDQSTAVTFTLMPVITGLASLGLWLRLALRNVTPSACIVLGGKDCPAVFNLPIAPLSMALSLSLTITIFTFVYSLVIGPSVSVNYLAFQMWIMEIYLHLRENKVDHTGGRRLPNLSNEEKAMKINEYFGNAVKELEKNLPYEPGSYALFVQDSLLEPIIQLRDYFSSTVVKNSEILPQVINLPRQRNPKLVENHQRLLDLAQLMGEEL
jgi:hypothetical protein